MTKLLFSDIDGTLLRKDGTISPALARKLREMGQAGHGMILCSGRPLDGILLVQSYLESLSIHFPYSYVIANNGALVYDCNEKKAVLEDRLPIELIPRAQALAKQYHVHLQTYTDHEIVCEKETPELLHYQAHVKIPAIFAPDYTKALSRPPFKMLALSLDGSDALKQFRVQIQTALGDGVQTMFSGAGYLEIFSAQASKGNALRFLCDYLSVPVSDSIAVGDSENDIPMLLAAGLGAAMQNATETVKSSAGFITALDHEHDGLAELIDTYIL